MSFHFAVQPGDVATFPERFDQTLEANKQLSDSLAEQLGRPEVRAARDAATDLMRTLAGDRAGEASGSLSGHLSDRDGVSLSVQLLFTPQPDPEPGRTGTPAE